MLEAQDMKLTQGQQVRQTAFFMALQATGYNNDRPNLDGIKETAEHLESWLWGANTKQQSAALAKALAAMAPHNLTGDASDYRAKYEALTLAASPFI